MEIHNKVIQEIESFLYLIYPTVSMVPFRRGFPVLIMLINQLLSSEGFAFHYSFTHKYR